MFLCPARHPFDFYRDYWYYVSWQKNDLGNRVGFHRDGSLFYCGNYLFVSITVGAYYVK